MTVDFILFIKFIDFSFGLVAGVRMEAYVNGWDSSLSLRHGARCVPFADTSVEDVLVADGEQIGFENIVLLEGAEFGWSVD